MQGKVDDSKPCHRLDAARQLLNLGFNNAHSVIQSIGQSASARAPSPAPTNSRINQELADIIKLETSDGREAVRFLVDVMQGKLQDFKPHHRLSAAKELLRRGFDITPGHKDDSEYEYDDHESFDDDDPRTPEQRDLSSPNYVGRYAHLWNREDDPFDFENYDEEEYRRDSRGQRALNHIYGGKEAAEVAREAVSEHRRKTFFDGHIPDRDFTPIENPDDDPNGKGHYGYKALRFAFGDNAAIRIANKAVEEYKRPPVDRPSCCYPNLTGNSPSEEDGTVPPDHWSLQYLDRTGNRSTEEDESSEQPDPGESEPNQSLENPDTGESEPRQFSGAKDPPKKRPVKIFLGPPDDSPRQCRDPGDFQSAIDGIWSAAPF